MTPLGGDCRDTLGYRQLAHPIADDIVGFAVNEMVETGIAKRGDIVVVLVGSPADPEPTTDVIRLVRVR